MMRSVLDLDTLCDLVAAQLYDRPHDRHGLLQARHLLSQAAKELHGTLHAYLEAGGDTHLVREAHSRLASARSALRWVEVYGESASHDALCEWLDTAFHDVTAVLLLLQGREAPRRQYG